MWNVLLSITTFKLASSQRVTSKFEGILSIVQRGSYHLQMLEFDNPDVCNKTYLSCRPEFRVYNTVDVAQ
jgi:hypothetical protein